MQREGLFAQKELEENTDLNETVASLAQTRLASIRSSYKELKEAAYKTRDEILKQRNERNTYGMRMDSLKTHNDVVTCLMLKVYDYCHNVIGADDESQPLTADLWRRLTVLYLQNFNKITPESVTAAISELMTKVSIATAEAEKMVEPTIIMEMLKAEDKGEKCIIC